MWAFMLRLCACVSEHIFVYFTHMWLRKPVVKNKASEGKINQ